MNKTMACYEGLKPGEYVTKERQVSESLWRRLNTERGRLLRVDQEEYMDLRDFEGSAFDERELNDLIARVHGVAERDDRIIGLKVETSVVSTATTASVNIQITGRHRDTGGPFELVFPVGEASKKLGYQ